MTQEREEIAELLLDELVTNSVLHAGLRQGDRVAVDVRIDDTEMDVRVSDPGSREWIEQSSDEHGRGFRLIGRLADAWGFERSAGTRAWFRLGLRQPAHAAARSMRAS
jgi:anti-sigma regulatory factor (Ser/Thr protein kinase)